MFTYVIWLSQFRWAMSKLTILFKWAWPTFKEMFAHLSFELLLKCIELTLVTVEVIIVWLLGQMLQNLTWWVVEVSWSSFGVETFSLILGLWLSLWVKWSGWTTLFGWRLTIFLIFLFFLWSLHGWLNWLLNFWVTSKVEVLIVRDLTVLNNLVQK